MGMLEVALGPATVVVAVDPGKVMNRVWVSNGAGLLEEPVSLPVARSGIAALEKMLATHAGDQVIAIEATGSLHRAWAAELERRHPGVIRVFAPSETKAARTQLGSGRFKTDDRDCAALTYLARQGGGRRQPEEARVEELRAAVRHRRGLVADRRKAQQRLHDQLNALCPGLSAPDGHATLGRALPIETPTGQAVLACAVAFAGRAPTTRSLGGVRSSV
jgi:transposase